jgi:hypothetical protein
LNSPGANIIQTVASLNFPKPLDMAILSRVKALNETVSQQGSCLAGEGKRLFCYLLNG